jgi:Niemann-Pick C1 protein
MLQVIPFLVLAVGVDNMFILANTLDTTDASAPLPERIGQALSSAGPSIPLAATAGELPATAVSIVEESVVGPLLIR